MFKIGDRVTSKVTGLPIVGTITGLIEAETFLGLLRANPNDFARWGRTYPDWMSKKVCIVQSDTPQRTTSFKEFMNDTIPSSPQELKKMQITYNVFCPITHHISFPEEDLEIL